jgi:hypothetical protein
MRMRGRLGIAMLLGLGMAASGCGPDEQGSPDGGPDAGPDANTDAGVTRIEAGTADLAGNGFVPIADGSDATLIPGAQSGFHVWLNVRVQGIAGELRIERAARRQRDDTLVFRGLAQRLDVPEAALGTWWESPIASPAFMCPSPIGIQVFDEPLVFEVRLLDLDGVILAEDSLVLVPRCPAGEQEAFCRSICAG